MEDKTNNTLPSLNKKTLLKLLLSFLISVILFYFILKYISFAEIINNLQQTSVLVVLTSCFFLLINYFFRALRIHILLSKKIDFFHVYLITILHNTLIQLLPFRLGEFSFLYFTAKTKKVTTIDAGTALVSARFFDMIIIISSFFISFLFLDATLSFPIPKIFFLLIFSIILAGVMLILLVRKRQLLLAKYLSKRQEKKTLFISLLMKIDQMLTFFHSIHSKKVLLSLFFYSICVWISYYVLMYFLYLSSGITFSYMNFLFIVSAALLFALIPLQGIAGFGNVEISWSALIILFGIERALALKTTLLVHIMGIIATLILGLSGLVLFLFYEKRINKRTIDRATSCENIYIERR